MQEESNKEVANSRSLNWWLRLIATTAILFVVAIMVYIYLFIYGGWEMILTSLTPKTDQENISIDFPNLAGEVFFTALVDDPESESTTNYLPVAANSNGTSAEQGMHILIDHSENASILSIQHTFSADSTKLTFLGWSLTEDLSYPTPAIYRADVSGDVSNKDEFIQTIQTTATLVLEPDEEDYFRQGPVISNAGNILYSSLPETGFNPEPSIYGSVQAEEWTIYHLDTDNERQSLTKGLSPKWVDENSFAFLKNDGIYLYDISTGEEKLIWNLNLIPNLLTAFDVSDDGQFLAIANIETGTVILLENKGWGSEVPVEVFSEVSTKASGLTFAADNSYLAISQLRDADATTATSISNLVGYYSLEFKLFHDNYMNLEIPLLQGLHITDWK